MWTWRRTELCLVACATLFALGGCTLDGTPRVPYCYEEPMGAFAPHPTAETPVFDEPAWSLVRPPEGLMTRVWLPWEYGQRAYYSIEEGDEAVFRMRFLIGETTLASSGVRVACFVEGRPVEVDVGGPLRDQSTVLVSGGSGFTDIVLGPDQLLPGLNQVDVFATYQVEGRWVLHASESFTIANGSLTPQTYEETTLEESTAPANQFFSSFTDATGREVPLVFGPTDVSTQRGALNLTLRVGPGASDASCDGGFDRFAIAALRDGLAVPIEGFDRIVTTMHGNDRKQLRYRVPLWTDRAEHSYVVVTLHGLGRTTHNDDGLRSAAAQPLAFRTGIRWNGAQ